MYTQIAKAGNNSLCVVIGKVKINVTVRVNVSWDQNTLKLSPHPPSVFAVWLMASPFSLKKAYIDMYA